MSKVLDLSSQLSARDALLREAQDYMLKISEDCWYQRPRLLEFVNKITLELRR